MCTNHGANNLNVIGYVGYASGEKHGVGRTLMRFPGLRNDSTFSKLQDSQINNVKLHKREVSGQITTGFINAYYYTGADDWTENGTACNNITWGGNGIHIDEQSISSYSANWVVFNITEAAKEWKTNPISSDKGIILQNSNEIDSSSRKDFHSTEASSTGDRPYLSFDYHIPVDSIEISDKSVNVNSEVSLSPTIEPNNATNKNVTYSISNSNITTITSGKAKGINPGIATVTANAANNKSDTFKVTVNPISGSYTTVSAGNSYNGTITKGRHFWYKFTPPTSGNYTFATTGSTDTYGILYKGTSQIASNDDGGEGYNFSITHSLNAGTEYRLLVKGYNENNTGSFTLNIKGKNAIIILPGVMGSEMFYNGSKIWESANVNYLKCNADGTSYYDEVVPGNQNHKAQGTYKHLYNRLSNAFPTNKYSVEYFPYDWRMSCKKSAEKLNQHINNKGYVDVVIVAHSMGGLVASSYIAMGNNQKNKVKKLITLGTPFLGAPESINVYMNGLNLGWIEELVINNDIKTITPNLTSMYELFPTKKANQYKTKDILTVGSSNTTDYSALKQTFYSKLNNYNGNRLTEAEQMHDELFTGNSHITSQVDSYYIYGTGINTVTNIEVIYNSTNGSINTCIFNEDTNGDGTVPTWSASLGWLYKNKTFYANNMKHAGVYNHNNNTVKEEGLVVSNNVITKVINIINNNNSNVSGIFPA